MDFVYVYVVGSNWFVMPISQSDLNRADLMNTPQTDGDHVARDYGTALADATGAQLEVKTTADC
jgi:hypothetical protein